MVDVYYLENLEAEKKEPVPVAPESEKVILGACIWNPDLFWRVVEDLSEEDFYYEKNRRIFSVISEQMQSAGHVDLVSVSEALRERKQLGASSLDHLAGMVKIIPAAVQLGIHIRRVREKSSLRKLIKVSSDSIQESQRSGASPDEILAKAEKKILDIVSKAKSPIRPISHFAEEFADQQIREAKGEIPGVMCGIDGIDSWFHGFDPGSLVVIAGRPSMGKTALALKMMSNMGASGLPTLIFSIETTGAQLMQRMTLTRAKVASNKFRDKSQMSPHEHHRVTDAANHVRLLPIYIDDSGATTISRMRASALRARAEIDIAAIFCDYLQLIKSEGPRNKKENRTQEVSEMTRAMKLIAKECEIPFFCLSQLNRDVEKRSPPIPRLSDLRDSGSIEQDADDVLFLYRPEYYATRAGRIPKIEDVGRADVIVGKSRNGPTGVISLKFTKEYFDFS